MKKRENHQIQKLKKHQKELRGEENTEAGQHEVPKPAKRAQNSSKQLKTRGKSMKKLKK